MNKFKHIKEQFGYSPIRGRRDQAISDLITMVEEHIAFDDALARLIRSEYINQPETDGDHERNHVLDMVNTLRTRYERV